MIRTSMVMVGLLMVGTASGCAVLLEKEENPRQARECTEVKQVFVRADREPVDPCSLWLVVKDASLHEKKELCRNHGHMDFGTCFFSAPVPVPQDY